MSTSANSTESDAYEGWAIVEIMGHRRHAGFVREAKLFGGTFIRIDQPRDDDETKSTTFFYGAESIFGFTPVSEEAARAAARSLRHAPVQPWELAPKQLPSPVTIVDDDEEPADHPW